MRPPTINENRPAFAVEDAHGQAAMLLVESLIHGLIAKSVLTPSDAVEIVEIAADVQEDIAALDGDASARRQRSKALLTAIADSLRRDIDSK